MTRFCLPVLACVRFNALGPVPPGWQDGLPEAYQQRLAQMRSATARQHTLAGLRLLAALTGSSDLRALTVDVDGRPAWPGGPVFSISHSGAYCLVLLAAAGAVGVDVEQLRAVRHGRILRLLGENERAAAALDRAAFFRAWCAREATIKASGRVGPRRLAAARLYGDDAEIDGHTYHLQRPAFDADYALCVAARPALPALAVQDWSTAVSQL